MAFYATDGNCWVVMELDVVISISFLVMNMCKIRHTILDIRWSWFMIMQDQNTLFQILDDLDLWSCKIRTHYSRSLMILIYDHARSEHTIPDLWWSWFMIMQDQNTLFQILDDLDYDHARSEHTIPDLWWSWFMIMQDQNTLFQILDDLDLWSCKIRTHYDLDFDHKTLL